MTPDLEHLLRTYEAGRITRRELLGALSLMLAGMPATAGAAEPVAGTVRQLNHVTVFVDDVQRSAAFYQRLFGMPILTRQDAGINLDTGSGFLGIYPSPAGRTGIDHVCFGLEGFDADAVQKQLGDAGVKATIRLRGDTKELYFTDPDNVRVQLQDVRYRGGVGPLGDRDPR
jgi:catechol 2,3-dioxygenase-like lactoylglutathione lyase family enzyme